MDEIARQQFIELEKNHWWFQGRRKIFFNLLNRFLNNDSQLKILDVGCGTGMMMKELSKYGQTWGIDYDEEMIDICRQNGFNNVLKASATDLPFEDNTFDLITFFDCLEHVKDEEKALQEAWRILKPNGYIFISLPAYQFLYANNDRIAHHQRRYTLKEIRKKVNQTGFTPLHYSYINVFLFPIILVAVLLIKLKEKTENTNKNNNKTNLSYTYPNWLNKILAFIFSSEQYLVRNWTLPVGHSICIISAKKIDC